MWVRVEEEQRQADRRFRVDRTIRSYQVEDLFFESDFGLVSVSSFGIAFLRLFVKRLFEEKLQM